MIKQTAETGEIIEEKKIRRIGIRHLEVEEYNIIKVEKNQMKKKEEY